MPLSYVQAALQILLIAISFKDWKRLPFFTASLAVWLPALLLAPEFFHPHATWERLVWAPCAVVVIPLQGLAVLEGYFAFAGRYRMAIQISAGMALLTIPFVLAFVSIRNGTLIEELVAVALWQRVTCAVFTIAAATFFLIELPSEVLRGREGRHLLLLAAWMLTWALGSLRGAALTWELSLSVTWLFWARIGLLAAWIIYWTAESQYSLPESQSPETR